MLLTRLLKFTLNYFRALKTLQCHLLKAKFAVPKSPQPSKTKLLKSSEATVDLLSRKQIDMCWVTE